MYLAGPSTGSSVQRSTQPLRAGVECRAIHFHSTYGHSTDDNTAAGSRALRSRAAACIRA